MLQQKIRKTFDIGGGRMVTIETGRLARQADGAVTVSMGNCMILATVCANTEPKEGQSFFPLSVDYQEKFAAAPAARCAWAAATTAHGCAWR